MKSKASDVKKSAEQSPNPISKLGPFIYEEPVLKHGLKLDRDFSKALHVRCAFKFIGEDKNELTIIVDYDPSCGHYLIYEVVIPKYAFRQEREETLDEGDAIDKSSLLSRYPEIAEYIRSIEVNCDDHVLDFIDG